MTRTLLVTAQVFLLAVGGAGCRSVPPGGLAWVYVSGAAEATVVIVELAGADGEILAPEVPHVVPAIGRTLVLQEALPLGSVAVSVVAVPCGDQADCSEEAAAEALQAGEVNTSEPCVGSFIQTSSLVEIDVGLGSVPCSINSSESGTL